MYMYAIMKTTGSPGYYQYDFVPTYVLRNMMYMMNHTSCAQVHELPQGHCGDNREGTLFS